MGSLLSKAAIIRFVKSKRAVVAVAAFAALYWRLRRSKPKRIRSQRGGGGGGGDLEQKEAHKGKTKRVAVDRVFIRRLRKIMSQACGWRETTSAIMLSGTLLARTLMSVWMANHMGKVVNAFCRQQWDILIRHTWVFALVTVGGGVLNASLRYYSAMLMLNIRQCLMHYLHDLYLKRGAMMYYKANKVGDDKFENADQLLTDDVEKFCTTVTDVFSQALKPSVDFVVFSLQLAREQGLVGPFGLYTWFFIATVISMKVMPSYGRLAAEKQRLEGKLRAAHSDLLTSCEQIAFMGGERPEKVVLNMRYEEIHDHEVKSTWAKFASNVVQQYVNKYFATVVGLWLIVHPVYTNRNGAGSWTPGDIAKYYVSVSRIMAGLSEAVLSLFDMSNHVGKLAGLTARISYLIHGLQYREPVLEQEIVARTKAGNPPRFVKGDVLRFEDVAVYRPDGVLLVDKLNFEVKKGDRVIITGPNGCGKSSLFRVLRGLWPLVAGTITKPANSSIYFLSQVNFVPLGSLRDLIIYPDTVEEMKKKGRVDRDLYKVMKWADLSGLEFDGRRPALDDVRDWKVDLSPGQKQRMAFARLLYHRPTYAVLDECTNGISPDVEAGLYARCRKLGMAVFSISHKIELKQLHDYELHYVGDPAGNYTFRRCDEDKQTSLDMYSQVAAAESSEDETEVA